MFSEPLLGLLPSCPASEHMALSAPRLPSYALMASTADLPALDPSHLRAVPQACRLSAFTPSPEDGFLSSPAFLSALLGLPTGGEGKPKAFLVFPLPLPHATASIPTCGVCVQCRASSPEPRPRAIGFWTSAPSSTRSSSLMGARVTLLFQPSLFTCSSASDPPGAPDCPEVCRLHGPASSIIC